MPSACGEVAHSAEGTACRLDAGCALLEPEPGERGDQLLADLADPTIGQRGGACGWLVVIARPVWSVKVGCWARAVRADVVVVEQFVVAGAEQDEVVELGLAAPLDRGEVVGFEFAGGGAARVLAVG